MKWLLTTTVLMSVAAMTACQSQPRAESAQAPLAYEAEPFEPVTVEPAPTQQPIAPTPVASAPASLPPAGPAQRVPTVQIGGTSYVVQKNDTLWSIAQGHYGDGQRWVDIVAANPGLVPEQLHVGREIILP